MKCFNGWRKPIVENVPMVEKLSIVENVSMVEEIPIVENALIVGKIPIVENVLMGKEKYHKLKDVPMAEN